MDQGEWLAEEYEIIVSPGGAPRNRGGPPRTCRPGDAPRSSPALLSRA
jgi:hypothetical protein